MKRIEDSLRDLLDNIKPTNIRITGVPEETEKKKGTEKIFEELKTSLTWERKEWFKSRKLRQSHTEEIQGETCQDTY